MTNTTLEQVMQYAEKYNLIPVVRTIMADTETPIRIFQHFYQEPRAFLLESVEGGVKWARYSFIGTDPFLMIRGKNGSIEIEKNGQVERVAEKPIETLKAYLRSFRSPAIEQMPPFTGGAIGFFGYDLLQYYENLPAHAVDDMNMNDIQFMFCDQVIAFDHMKQQIQVMANIHIPEFALDNDIKTLYEQAVRKIESMMDRLRQPIPHAMMSSQPIPEQVDLGDVASNISKEQYIANVHQAKALIRAGDIFQVVLSQRFHLETEVSPLQVYRVLRTMNPSPYMYYLKMDDEVIVGASPEALVKVKDGRIETKPIAGTRPRGATPEEDEALESELLSDEKERAEHLMLVDLGRNDIGRVSEFGTVRCDTYMEIERYSHVMHIVSNVSGQLRRDKDFFDALLSCMPAGTLSGAPKIRAMEIIAEMERESRGAYGGAIGYLGFNGNMDTCITIRTMIFKNGKAYVQAGAGIVWDSIPENEYQETVNKAMGCLKAIRMAEAIFPNQRKDEVQYTNLDYFVRA